MQRHDKASVQYPSSVQRKLEFWWGSFYSLKSEGITSAFNIPVSPSTKTGTWFDQWAINSAISYLKNITIHSVEHVE